MLWDHKCGCCREELASFKGKLVFEIDHFFPTSMGGPDVFDNKWPLCLLCHRKKTLMESKRNFSEPWCLLCNTYYEDGESHPCMRERYKEVTSCRDLEMKGGLVNPDDWMKVFGYKEK